MPSTEPTLYNPRERRIYGLLKQNEEGLTAYEVGKMLPNASNHQINSSLLQLERRRVIKSELTSDSERHSGTPGEIKSVKVYSLPSTVLE